MTDRWCDRQTVRQTDCVTDRRTNKHTSKKSRHAKNFFVCAPILTQVVLKHPHCHEGSKYVLRFEIGQQESGFYRGQTDRWTSGNYNIDLPFTYYEYLTISLEVILETTV